MVPESTSRSDSPVLLVRESTGPADHSNSTPFRVFRMDEDRANCIAMAFLAIPKGLLFSFPHRIWDLARLGSIRRGYLYGQIDCQKKMFHAKKSGRNNSYYLSVQKVMAYCRRSAFCLGTDIVKIASFPIYLLAIESFFLLGCLFPKPGRRSIAKTQRIWEFDNLLERRRAQSGHRDFDSMLRFLNSDVVHYIDPHYLNPEDRDRLHLAIYFPDYHHKALRSLWLSLQQDLETYGDLIPNDTFANFQETLYSVKTGIGNISPDPAREVSRGKNGFFPVQNHLWEIVRGALEKTHACLHQYIRCEKEIAHLRNSFSYLQMTVKSVAESKNEPDTRKRRIVAVIESKHAAFLSVLRFRLKGMDITCPAFAAAKARLRVSMDHSSFFLSLFSGRLNAFNLQYDEDGIDILQKLILLRQCHREIREELKGGVLSDRDDECPDEQSVRIMLLIMLGSEVNIDVLAPDVRVLENDLNGEIRRTMETVYESVVEICRHETFQALGKPVQELEEICSQKILREQSEVV